MIELRSLISKNCLSLKQTNKKRPRGCKGFTDSEASVLAIEENLLGVWWLLFFRQSGAGYICCAELGVASPSSLTKEGVISLELSPTSGKKEQRAAAERRWVLTLAFLCHHQRKADIPALLSSSSQESSALPWPLLQSIMSRAPALNDWPIS